LLIRRGTSSANWPIAVLFPGAVLEPIPVFAIIGIPIVAICSRRTKQSRLQSRYASQTTSPTAAAPTPLWMAIFTTILEPGPRVCTVPPRVIISSLICSLDGTEMGRRADTGATLWCAWAPSTTSRGARCLACHIWQSAPLPLASTYATSRSLPLGRKAAAGTQAPLPRGGGLLVFGRIASTRSPSSSAWIGRHCTR
jgi:hypothetical protein